MHLTGLNVNPLGWLWGGGVCGGQAAVGLQCLAKSLHTILEASEGPQAGGTLSGLCPEQVTPTAAGRVDLGEEKQFEGHSSRKGWWLALEPWEGEVRGGAGAWV